MVRVLGAGLIGGLVLTVWSVVFSAVGPAEAQVPPSDRSAATINALREHAANAGIDISFGPALANAAPQERPETSVENVAPSLSLDFAQLARTLAVACAASTIAAVLMAWFGGARRPFAERVFFAVLLGAFAGLTMVLPAGGWAEFSMHRTMMYLGEVLVGWTLAGLVIAVMLNPKKVKA
jgi:hypothetical protein